MSKHNLEDYERTHCLVIVWFFLVPQYILN